MSTLRRMQQAIREDRHPTYIEACAAAADDMVAEALAARDAVSGPDPLAALGASMLADSAAWFAKSHARGHEAVTVHFAMGVGGEAGEVVDVIKKADICGLVDECDMHARGKHGRGALASELADVLTYTLALAAHEGIDLLGAYQAKRAENVARWGDPKVVMPS